LIEQCLTSQRGGGHGLEREVRGVIAPIEQINASSIKELNIVEGAANIDARRAHQLSCDNIQRGRLRSPCNKKQNR